MEVQIIDTKWPETLFDDEGDPRRDGLHLGTVIKSLQNASGLGYKGGGFEDMNVTAEIGLLWELILSRIMREKYAVRPPQIEVDGIWMSPDGVGFEDPLGAISVAPDPAGEEPVVVEEYKAAWASTKNNPTDNFYYMCQAKSYCHAIDTPVVVFRIFHVMGNYRGSGPIYRIARIRFTPKELTDNWAMILRHKATMIEKGEIDG